MNENPYNSPQEQSATIRSFWPKLTLLNLIGTVFLIAVLIALLLPAQQRVRPAAIKMQCKNNLKQIVLALHIYQQSYKSFPPAYTVDEQGQPLHSWRTLILPFVDQAALYERIDLSQPWNSPVNEEAYRTAMWVYTCPSTQLGAGMTTYQAIVGPEAMFDPVKSRTLEEIKDGPSNTVSIIDVNPELAVHWMSPLDHGQDFLLTMKPTTKLQHTGGTHVALGDGSIRFISESTSLETRRALITISGNDVPGEF